MEVPITGTGDNVVVLYFSIGEDSRFSKLLVATLNNLMNQKEIYILLDYVNLSPEIESTVLNDFICVFTKAIRQFEILKKVKVELWKENFNVEIPFKVAGHLMPDARFIRVYL